MQFMRISPAILFVSIFLVWFPTNHASAARSYALAVPREAASRPDPVVDGVCDVDEYINAWKLTRLYYRPRVSWESVRMAIVSNDTDLYICLENLPFRLGTVEPFVSLAFDTAHDGGRRPDSDDLRFDITETGATQALRGDGNAFTVDPSITGWSAARANFGEFAWTAEFRIPLSLLGGGDPFSVIGFHVRHNWVRFQPDDYAWPPSGGWNVPNTWGDLFWLRAVTGVGPVRLDTSRITQGLEYDLTGGVNHDLIVGKDTLVRAQLYTLGEIPEVNTAVCVLQKIAPTRSGQRFIFVSPTPAPRINSAPFGFFNGSPVLDFWIRGRSFIHSAGTYQFTLQVWLEGESEPRIINLGTRTFVESRDFRILLVPWENTFAGDSRSWGPDLAANIPQSMQEMSRMFPIRSGVGSVNLFPRGDTSGLRYLLWFGGSCSPDDEDFGDCDRTGRQIANDIYHRLNRQLARSDRADERDRLDRYCLLGLSTGTGGGQAQFGWDPPSAGAGFDANLTGASASVINQEVMHCLGRQVEAGSPNNNGGAHSINRTIPLARGLPMVNMLTRTDVASARSVLFGIVTNSPITFTEGYEWNALRRVLVGLPLFPSAPPRLAPEAGRDLFHLVGSINIADELTVRYTQRTDEDTLAPTPTAGGSPYAVLFFDADDNQVGGHRFPVSFEATHGDPEPLEELGLVVTTLLPADAARVEVRKNSTLLYAETFSSAAPVVSNVVANNQGQGGIDLNWSATDADSPDLSFNIYLLLPAVQAIRLPVMTGYKGTSYFLPTHLLPAINGGQVIVEATDGFNTGEAVSNAFSVEPQPPSVAIVHPDGTTPLVEGQLFALVGSAHDTTSGPLTGDALSWESDKDGALGTGEQLETSLTAGNHTITLTATGPTGLTATDTVDVTVEPDMDGDGLSDAYEKQNPCLSEQAFDSDQDHDGDGLASYGEWKRGTDPCNPDTDQDGVGDGDEVRLGSDPDDENSQPQPDLLFVPDDVVDLGTCPDDLKPQTLNVLANNANVVWDVSASEEWLQVNGGGTGDGTISVSADCEALAPGDYTGQLLILVDGGQPVLVDVVLAVTGPTDVRKSWTLYR